jgi:hypothetical protein
MKHMGWSYDQLMLCPEHYVAVISEEAQREHAERTAAARAR